MVFPSGRIIPTTTKTACFRSLRAAPVVFLTRPETSTSCSRSSYFGNYIMAPSLWVSIPQHCPTTRRPNPSSRSVRRRLQRPTVMNAESAEAQVFLSSPPDFRFTIQTPTYPGSEPPNPPLYQGDPTTLSEPHPSQSPHQKGVRREYYESCDLWTAMG